VSAAEIVVGGVATAQQPADFTADVKRIIHQLMLWLHRRGLTAVTHRVGELLDGVHYHAEHGASAATLVELYRLCRWACHPDF